MEDSLYLFHGNQSLITKCKQMDFHGFRVSLVSHHFKRLSCKDRAVQILATKLLISPNFLLWQVSFQTEADLDPLPGAQGSLCSNRNYTFAPSPALSSWHHKTTPGAAAPHHKTSNFVGIIGYTLVFEMNITCQSTSITLVCLKKPWCLEAPGCWDLLRPPHCLQS